MSGIEAIKYPYFINTQYKYDSYIIPESDLEVGQLRLLEVDNQVIMPELTHTRFVVAGADVIHSYACPSLGIKCDAYPGILNMPITIQSTLKLEHFIYKEII